MLTRTKHTTARFNHPFLLTGFEAPQPPGEYDIDEDEQIIEGLSWVAYRRVATFIHLPARNAGARTRQVIEILHAELETALELDRRV